MSQYANFYVKPKTAPYLPVGDYSRSTQLYQIVQFQLPYGEITPITEATIEAWVHRGNELLNSYKDQVKKLQMRKEEVFHYSNTADEKYSLCIEIDESIKDYEETIEEVRDAISTFYLFYRLIDAIRFEDGYDVSNYLYAGIETNPNEEENAE